MLIVLLIIFGFIPILIWYILVLTIFFNTALLALLVVDILLHLPEIIVFR